MRTRIGTAADFLQGSAADISSGRERHEYRAEWVEGRGLVVRDKEGNEVKVTCAGTTDNRTMYVRVEGEGFIGGWQYPHKAQPFKRLVDSINRGILYTRTDALPKRSTE